MISLLHVGVPEAEDPMHATFAVKLRGQVVDQKARGTGHGPSYGQQDRVVAKALGVTYQHRG